MFNDNCRELFLGGALLDMSAATATAEVAAARHAMSCVLFSTAVAAALQSTAAAGAGKADAWPAPGATFNSIMEQMHVALPDLSEFERSWVHGLGLKDARKAPLLNVGIK